MALNDGYAVDAQGRRIYFPPIGQPRLVPTREEEARFNERVLWCLVIALLASFAGMAVLIFVPETSISTTSEWLVFYLDRERSVPRLWPVDGQQFLTIGHLMGVSLSRPSAGKAKRL